MHLTCCGAQVRVRVIRDGHDVPVAVADVVVGDVLHLETGDKVGCPWRVELTTLCVVVTAPLPSRYRAHDGALVTGRSLRTVCSSPVVA